MSKFRDLTGQTFGRWTVIGVAPPHPRFGGKTGWIARCECGTVRNVVGSTLTSGASVSCGCYKREAIRASITTHGLSSHPNFYIWHMMIARCHKPTNGEFKNYGARGITVCEAWRSSIAQFIADMGTRPSMRHTLDRIDNNGPYSPENCRWATIREQCNNTRRNRFIEFNGERLTSTQWSARLGGGKWVVKNRIKYGWPIDRAVTEPIAKRR